MKIYLAGKIDKDDWRQDVLSFPSDFDGILSYFGNGPWVMDHEGNWIIDKEKVILRKSIMGKHDYCGPYFIACDHGCFHGDCSHGVGANVGTGNMCSGFHSPNRSEIVNFAVECIERCDLMIVWFTNKDRCLDAYGTIFEIGVAKALEKRIVVGTSRMKLPMDLWFSLSAANAIVANTTLQDLIEEATDPQRWKRLLDRYAMLKKQCGKAASSDEGKGPGRLGFILRGPVPYI